jgi:hypothetical protein
VTKKKSLLYHQQQNLPFDDGNNSYGSEVTKVGLGRPEVVKKRSERPETEVAKVKSRSVQRKYRRRLSSSVYLDGGRKPSYKKQVSMFSKLFSFVNDGWAK